MMKLDEAENPQPIPESVQLAKTLSLNPTPSLKRHLRCKLTSLMLYLKVFQNILVNRETEMLVAVISPLTIQHAGNDSDLQ